MVKHNLALGVSIRRGLKRLHAGEFEHGVSCQIGAVRIWYVSIWECHSIPGLEASL